MIVVADTSALIALVFAEPEAPDFARALLSAETACASVATLLELHMVVRRRRPEKSPLIDQLIEDYGLTLEAVTADQLAIARDAFDRYGKGLGHPAQLNFGDCFAYALAKSRNAPLLFKGGDFAKTDVRAAVV